MKTSETCEFNGFTVDGRRRTVRYAGRDVRMPARSFDVLAALIERHGTVVGKDTLMAVVWAGVAVEENTLAQAVSGLRRALRAASGEDGLVLTVPGQGYQFTASVRAVTRPFSSSFRLRLASAALVIIAAAAVSAAVWRLHALHFWESHCVAVIPFEALDAEAATGAAVADGLVARLAAPQRLRIRPMTAVLGTPTRDYRGLGRTLKVDRIVAGTVRAVHGGTRVTVELIDVKTEAAVWAGSFDEPASGAGPSDELLSRIADALRPRIAS